MGLGSKPIELNVDRELFLQTILYGKTLMKYYLKDYLETQKNINEEGYYPKDRDTGRVVVK